MTDAATVPAHSEPVAELGPAMRILPLRWQRAVVALFLTGGNRTQALRRAGYTAPDKSTWVTASRVFADPRVRAAVKEVAAQQIDIAEPELLATTLAIMRDQNEPARDRLRAVAMVWDRANPVINKTQIDVAHHLSTDERDVQHYRALQKLGAPEQAFLDRFGHAGLARVQAMAAAEEAKQRQIEGGSGVIDADYQEIST
jgi:phage terminase small subunit